MIKIFSINGLYRLAVSTIFVLMMGTTAYAQVSECPDIPKSDFWSKTTHDTIISYVKRKHDGDWKPYIKKWEKQLDSMRKIHEAEGSATFKSKKRTISGDELAEYIKLLEVRVEVTKCLSARAQ